MSSCCRIPHYEGWSSRSYYSCGYTSGFSLLGHSCLGRRLNMSPLRACPAFFLLSSLSLLSLSTIAVKFDSLKCKLILNYRSPPLKETVNLSNTLCRIQRWSLCLWKEGDLSIFFYKYWIEVYKVKLPQKQPTKNLPPFLLWPRECFLNVMKYIKSVNIYYCVNSLKYVLFEAALYLFLFSFESA